MATKAAQLMEEYSITSLVVSKNGEKIDGIIKLARSAGRHVGILVDNENVEKYVNKGVRFLYTHLNAFLEKGANAFAERTKLNL